MSHCAECERDLGMKCTICGHTGYQHEFTECDGDCLVPGCECEGVRGGVKHDPSSSET